VPCETELIDGDGRCGPLFDGMYCTDTTDFTIYCNEINGWCGNTDEHKNAQPSTAYDAATYTQCLEQRASKFTADFI
jgi:hypothetical protein